MRGRGKPDRVRIPRPDPEVERKARGSGPVITYKLSEEELNKMREKDRPACGLTKQALIESIAAGETLSSVERAWKMKYNTIHVWVKRWGLQGITPAKAQELLREQAPQPPDDLEQAAEAPFQTICKLAEEFAASDDKDAEIERLQRELEAKTTAEQNALESAEKWKKNYDTLLNDFAALKERLEESAARLMQYEADKRSEGVSVSGDPVNHPAHYTAGAVECIDAIEAATTGLTGGQAYNTGAAIKYLWRWSRKGGTEDLRKARWYIDRLIGEGDAG